MAHTPFLNVIPQRHTTDCAVACLAMLLGVDYEASLLAFGKYSLVIVRDIKRAAKRLGYTLHWTRKFELETDTGILGVRSTKWDYEHLVVLKDGLIVDTDATVWDADVFLAAYEATPQSLLVVKEGKSDGRPTSTK